MRFFLFTILIISSQLSVSAQDVYVANVAIVLDGSGSMGDRMRGSDQTKMVAAKTAIKEVLKTIPQTTHVGLIAFGKNGNKWIFPLGPRNDSHLIAGLNTIKPGGGTPLGKYMKLGADALLEARNAQYGYGSYRLLVVTDGEAEDEQLVNRFTPDILSRGITVDVIGVDMNQDHTLANLVSSYRRANDPVALKTALQDVFAEIEKSGSDSDASNAFETLAGIPDGVAVGIINALATSDNAPIGESDQHNSSSRTLITRNHSSNTPAPPGQDQDGGKGAWMWVVVAIIAFLSLIKKKKHH